MSAERDCSRDDRPLNAMAEFPCGVSVRKMRVEVDRSIGVSAKTVGQLRKVTAWPENLVITTPEERRPESAVKVSKASVATRVSPKP
jgi:hypothetical protein